MHTTVRSFCFLAFFFLMSPINFEYLTKETSKTGTSFWQSKQCNFCFFVNEEDLKKTDLKGTFNFC